MRFSVHYNGQDALIDVTSWESDIDSRIEYYAVLADHEETFINFTKRTDQFIITEVSSSADLTKEIKSIIKKGLMDYIRNARL